MPADPVVIVSAYNEADRLGETLGALREAFPDAHVLVADDGSTDETPQLAVAAGAELVRAPRMIGKGGANNLAVEQVRHRARGPEPPVFVLCDGDLGASAGRLGPLVDAVRRGDCDLAVASFARRVGGGFGVAVGFSRWATRRLAGLELDAPISGQRAMRAEVFEAVTPFAARFGMETAMNIDAVRAGFRVAQVELELEHRATGRTFGGFVHRGRQLVDFALVYFSRARRGRS